MPVAKAEQENRQLKETIMSLRNKLETINAELRKGFQQDLSVYTARQ